MSKLNDKDVAMSSTSQGIIGGFSKNHCWNIKIKVEQPICNPIVVKELEPDWEGGTYARMYLGSNIGNLKLVWERYIPFHSGHECKANCHWSEAELIYKHIWELAPDPTWKTLKERCDIEEKKLPLTPNIVWSGGIKENKVKNIF